MSFVNPNFRSKNRKENLNDKNDIEMLDVNFNDARLNGEPRRQDIQNQEENIISLDSIIKSEEEVIYEYIGLPTIASLSSVPRIEELSVNDVAKIQISYLEKIGNTIIM